jgi:hypothetical protein
MHSKKGDILRNIVSSLFLASDKSWRGRTVGISTVIDVFYTIFVARRDFKGAF